MRGNNKERIFVSNDQSELFLKLLNNHEEIGKLSIVAWCIMSNHVHIVLKAEYLEMVKSFHRINTSFAMRQHRRQGTSGHVFQGRFWSEPIESEEYLVRAVRYVHNNPVKASLVSDAGEWDWSSYSKYLLGEYSEVMQATYQLLGGTLERFKSFHNDRDLQFRPIDTNEDRIRLRDQYTQSVLKELCRQYGIREWREELLCVNAMKDAVLCLVNENDFSSREVAKRLGITHNTVRRYVDLESR